MFRQAGHPFVPGPAATATTRQGACFRHSVPEGWQVVEDGQFAVVSMAPDRRALIVLTGNSGLPVYTNPGQYLYDKLAQTGLQGLRFGQGRPSQPLFGWSSAWEFDAEYAFQGIPCRGLARCSVAPAYDFCTMAMTWAASDAAQWGGYAGWLPDVADRVEITNGSAFGMAGIARQNQYNTAVIGEQARQNRSWSEQQWAEVTRRRGESTDRNHFEFRQAIGAVQRFDNPYSGQPIDLPATNAVYWINPLDGRIVGDPDPSFDPRSPADAHWQPLRPSR